MNKNLATMIINHRHTLTIPGVRERQTVPANDIVRIEASSNYSRIYLKNGQHLLTAKVLQWFQDLLPQEMFIRVHRSHLINREFVEKCGNGTQTLHFVTGEKIPVSRRNRPAVKRFSLSTAGLP